MAHCALFLGFVSDVQIGLNARANRKRILLLGSIAILGQHYLVWVDVSRPVPQLYSMLMT
jgi:hypothetical protein